MGKNTTNWTVQEEQLIKRLRDEQIQLNKTDWQGISHAIKIQFNKKKSAKQCRERYINYLKFDEENQLNLQWSQEEINLLSQLYLEKGPSWTQISSFFKTKSQNAIKNKFNSCLKVAAKNLNSFKIKLGRTSRLISTDILRTQLRISNEIIELLTSMGHPVNYDSLILKFRTNLVRLCFNPDLLSMEEISEMLETIRLVSTKLKSFKIFKSKDKRRLLVQQKSMQAISYFDSIIKSQNIKSQEKQQYTTKFEYQQMENIAFPPVYLHTFCTCYWCTYNLSHVKLQS